MPVATNAERSAFRNQLVEEIPAFLHFLLHEWDAPEDCADPRRYNVRSFHHPVLADSLESFSPEAHLLDLLDAVFADELTGHEGIELAAKEIEERLRAYDPRQTDKLFTFRNACGTYLGRLAAKHPERMEYIRTKDSRSWRILPCPK